MRLPATGDSLTARHVHAFRVLWHPSEEFSLWILKLRMCINLWQEHQSFLDAWKEALPIRDRKFCPDGLTHESKTTVFSVHGQAQSESRKHVSHTGKPVASHTVATQSRSYRMSLGVAGATEVAGPILRWRKRYSGCMAE
jgi:hypothetical protein